MKPSNKLVSSILTIVLGILLIVLKGEVVSIAMTVFGVAMIVLGVLDILHNLVTPGVVKTVVGVCVIVFGWTLVSVALYIFAALLLIFGILELYNTIKANTIGTTKWQTALYYIEPVISIIAGGCLLFNQGGTIAWVFILAGAFLIVEGVLALVSYLKEK